MRIVKQCLIFIPLFLNQSCGSRESICHKFIGDWHIEERMTTVRIKENGANFIVDIFNKDEIIRSYPAICKNQLLIMNVTSDSEAKDFEFVYDKSTDEVLMMGVRYKRKL